MNRLTRWLMFALVVAGLSAGIAQVAATQSSVSLVATINQTWGNFKVEDIVVCANGTEAWAVSVGPGALDDLQMFKITGFDTSRPAVDRSSTIFFGDDDFFGTGLPAGMGPRGFPGMDVDISCSFAYLPNFFVDSVVKVDLRQGIRATASDAGSVTSGDGTIMWPAGYSVGTPGSIPAPVDVRLNFPADNRVIVSSSAGTLYVLDARTGRTLATVETGGVGPGGLVVQGSAWAAAVQNSSDVACVDLTSGRLVRTISGLGINPYMAVANGDKSRIYVSNQGSNSVSVLAGSGCNKRVIATIQVGNAPRHLALSPDDRYLYVSNSTENTVSVIDTRSLRVVQTIAVVDSGEPAPIGVVAVSNNNRYLHVFWEGGNRGTPGRMQIRVFDVSLLYRTP